MVLQISNKAWFLRQELSNFHCIKCRVLLGSYAPIKSKLQHPPSPPPPGQTPFIWLFSVPGEWGIWRVRPSQGWGIWPCLGGVGKIEPEVSGFKSLFFWGGGGGGEGAPKSLTAIFTCLDEMEEFKGRELIFFERLAYKKGVQKWECLNVNYFYRLYINDVHFLYNEAAALWALSCGE